MSIILGLNPEKPKMKELSTVQKGVLESILLSRGMIPFGSKEDMLVALSKFQTPFGIDPSLPLYEKVLHMSEIPDYLIARYLGIPVNVMRQRNMSRQQLLEELFKKELDTKSKEVLEYSRLPLAKLKQLSGVNAGVKADMIRKILFPPEGNELLQEMKNTLISLKFKIASHVPEPIELKPLTKVPYTPKLALMAISQGQDPKQVPVELLEDLVKNYLLFRRKLKKDTVYEIMTDVAKYPVLPAWQNIRNYLQAKPFELLQQLAGTFGYPNLDKRQLEFFYSRGFIPGVESVQQVSRELDDSFTEIYGPNWREEIKNETPTRYEWIQTFISWDSLTTTELIKEMKNKGVDVNPDDVRSYIKDISLYLDVELYVIDLENPPDLDIESLLKYSDRALIDFFPQAPYGREKLINEFIAYWETEKYFYNEEKFYHGFLESNEVVEDGLDYNTLSLEELIDLSFWVKDNSEIRADILDEIRAVISEMDFDIEDVEEDIEHILYCIRRIASAAFGGSGEVPLEASQSNDLLFETEVETYHNLLNNLEDKDILTKLYLFDFRTMKFSSRTTIERSLRKGIDYRLFDSANFYLIRYYDVLDDLPTIARIP